MAKNSRAGKSNKSSERYANKATPPALARLERRLRDACGNYLRRINKKDLTRVRALLRRREMLFQELLNVSLELEDYLPNAEAFRVSLRDIPFLKERAQLDAEILNTRRRRGRPNIPPEIALVFYSELENALGDRSLLSQVGDLIKPGGSLNQWVDQKFGTGAFELLRIPVPSCEVRWERTVKSSLRRFAMEFVFAHPSMKKFRQSNPEAATAYFKKIVKRGGFTLGGLAEQRDI